MLRGFLKQDLAQIVAIAHQPFKLREGDCLHIILGSLPLSSASKSTKRSNYKILTLIIGVKSLSIIVLNAISNPKFFMSMIHKAAKIN